MSAGPKANWGHPVAYHPRLAHFFGSINAAVFFGQLAYWLPRASSELGVYKTAEEWTEETGLSYREQVTARKVLTDAGCLVETPKRLEHRIYYRIDWEAFNAAFGAWVERRGGSYAPVQKKRDPNDENAFREQPNAQSATVSRSNSSIEAETTAKTTAEKRSAAARAAVAPSAKAPQETATGKPRPVLVTVQELAAQGVSTEVAAGFLEQRQAKRAPLRLEDLEEIKREAANAGLALEDVLTQCVVGGWFKFKAKWAEGRHHGSPVEHPAAHAHREHIASRAGGPASSEVPAVPSSADWFAAIPLPGESLPPALGFDSEVVDV